MQIITKITISKIMATVIIKKINTLSIMKIYLRLALFLVWFRKYVGRGFILRLWSLFNIVRGRFFLIGTFQNRTWANYNTYWANYFRFFSIPQQISKTSRGQTKPKANSF